MTPEQIQPTVEGLETAYKNYWSSKKTAQIKKELLSWRKYMDKYGQAYAWHGSGMTPPTSIADGTKVIILKEILEERNVLL